MTVGLVRGYYPDLQDERNNEKALDRYGFCFYRFPLAVLHQHVSEGALAIPNGLIAHNCEFKPRNVGTSTGCGAASRRLHPSRSGDVITRCAVVPRGWVGRGRIRQCDRALVLGGSSLTKRDVMMIHEARKRRALPELRPELLGSKPYTS